MRLAAKFTALLFVCMLVALAVHAYVGVRRDIAQFEADVAQTHEVMASVLGPALEEVWEDEGREKALAMLSSADRGLRKIDIGWTKLDDVPRERPIHAARTGQVVRWFDRDGDHARLVTAVRLDAPAGGALVLGESLEREGEIVRDAAMSHVLGASFLALVAAVLSSVLGIVTIGRPIRALVSQARRIGAGDLAARSTIHQRDELGELGSEMDAMCARLSATLEQLRHADRLATVGKLASGMAHELGTPLNVVQMRAKMILSNASVTEDAHEAASVIREQTARMTTLIRQLLDFARPRKPHKTQVRLADVARRTVDLLGPVAAKSGISLRVDRADEGVVAEADAAQLEQVVMNLVMNAVHATASGGKEAASPEIAVRVERASTQPPAGLDLADGDYAAIVVEDRGTGIAPENVGRIFEPFFTTKDVGSGTGLGLSVAWGIVRDHGGWIDVKSDPEKGSTFSVLLRSRST